jgi:hypothetical protein
LLVEVSSADQKRIAVARNSETLTVDVKFSSVPGAGNYKKGTRFVALESAGHLIDVEQVEEKQFGLRVLGKIHAANRIVAVVR